MRVKKRESDFINNFINKKSFKFYKFYKLYKFILQLELMYICLKIIISKNF